MRPAYLSACINDFSVADVHEVVVSLANLLVEDLSSQVLLFFQHL